MQKITVPEAITELSDLLSREASQKQTVTTAQSQRAAELSSHLKGHQSLSQEHHQPLLNAFHQSLQHLALHSEMHDACHVEVDFLRSMLKSLLPEGDAAIDRLDDLFPCEKVHTTASSGDVAAVVVPLPTDATRVVTPADEPLKTEAPVAEAEALPVFLNDPVLEASTLTVVEESPRETVNPAPLSSVDEAYGSTEVAAQPSENPFEDAEVINSKPTSRKVSVVPTADITENSSEVKGVTIPQEANSAELKYQDSPDFATGMDELESTERPFIPAELKSEIEAVESRDSKPVIPAELKSEIESQEPRQTKPTMPEELKSEIEKSEPSLLTPVDREQKTDTEIVQPKSSMPAELKSEIEAVQQQEPVIMSVITDELKNDIIAAKKDSLKPKPSMSEELKADIENNPASKKSPEEQSVKAETKPAQDKEVSEVKPKSENPWFKKSGAQVVKEMAEKQPQPVSRRNSVIAIAPTSRRNSSAQKPASFVDAAPLSRRASKSSLKDPEGWVTISRRSSKNSANAADDEFFPKESYGQRSSARLSPRQSAFDVLAQPEPEVVAEPVAQDTTVADEEPVEMTAALVEPKSQVAEQSPSEKVFPESESDKSFVVLENTEVAADSPWMTDLKDEDLLMPLEAETAETEQVVDPLTVDSDDMKELSLWNPEQQEEAMESQPLEVVPLEEVAVEQAPQDSAIGSGDVLNATPADALAEEEPEEKHVTFDATPEIIGTQVEPTKAVDTMITEPVVLAAGQTSNVFESKPVESEPAVYSATPKSELLVNEATADKLVKPIEDDQIFEDAMPVDDVKSFEDVKPLEQVESVQDDAFKPAETVKADKKVEEVKPVEEIKPEQPSIWKKLFGFGSPAPSQKELEPVTSTPKEAVKQEQPKEAVVEPTQLQESQEVIEPVMIAGPLDQPSYAQIVRSDGKPVEPLVDHTLSEKDLAAEPHLDAQPSETEDSNANGDLPVELPASEKTEEPKRSLFSQLFAPVAANYLKPTIVMKPQSEKLAEKEKTDEAYESKEASPVEVKEDAQVEQVEAQDGLSPQQADELNFGNDDTATKKSQLPYQDVPDYATGLNELDEPSTSVKQRSNNPWFQKTGSRVLKESIARDAAPDFTPSPQKEPIKSEPKLQTQDSVIAEIEPASKAVDQSIADKQTPGDKPSSEPVNETYSDKPAKDQEEPAWVTVSESEKPAVVVTRQESEPAVADKNPFAVLADEELSAPLDRSVSKAESLNVEPVRKDSQSLASEIATPARQLSTVDVIAEDDKPLREDAALSQPAPVKKSLSDLMNEIKDSDSLNESSENPVLESTDMLALQDVAREEEPSYRASTVADSEESLSKNDDKKAPMQTLDAILDECIEIVRDDAAKTNEVLVAVPAPQEEAKGLAPEQVAELLANPYIPESVKDTIRKMQEVAPVQPRSAASYEDEIAKLKKENADLKNSTPSELAGFAQALEKENDDLAKKNHTMLVDNQKLQAALADVRGQMADVGILTPVASGEKHQLLDMEALNLIARLKKIWKSLMVLYLEDSNLPEIQSITEVQFILDQIEISIQIVSSHVDGIKA